MLTKAIIVSMLLPAFVVQDEFQRRRIEMVRVQIAARGVTDPAVLQAMTEVPRHQFVPAHWIDEAYKDHAMPIGYGQTISQPYIVAFMTEQIAPSHEMKVLEIGTGSGYQAAVLSPLVDSVFTIEIIEELHVSSAGRLKRLGYDNVVVRHSDGYFGWEEHAPFDAIVVTAAAEHIPPPLIAQLKDGGKMIIPVGTPFLIQTLMLIEKTGEDVTTKSLFPVRFVPLTRGR